MSKIKDHEHNWSEDETMLGKLIAEISKFGGSNKEDASRLARILLPHINAYTTNKIIEELEEFLRIAQGLKFQALVRELTNRIAELRKTL